MYTSYFADAMEILFGYVGCPQGTKACTGKWNRE
jgi:hypothetical protein